VAHPAGGMLDAWISPSLNAAKIQPVSQEIEHRLGRKRFGNLHCLQMIEHRQLLEKYVARTLPESADTISRSRALLARLKYSVP
jgi:hypothetical protein